LLECGGNIVSQLPISQRGTSGEQQIKLAIADETHVSDANARVVVCRGGLPGRCKIPDLQISAAATEKNDTLPKGIAVTKQVHFSVKGNIEHQEVGATCERWVQRLTPCIPAILVYVRVTSGNLGGMDVWLWEIDGKKPHLQPTPGL